MKSVGAFEAKTHLSQLLDRVSAGEEIAITKHGTPVAMLVPYTEKKQPTVSEVIDRMMAFRKGRTTGGTSVRHMIDEGRRR